LNSICIIPARGGSKRIPKKNIKNFLGKPVISYVIKIAKQSKLFDQVIVSTDHKDIAKISIKNGAKVYWRDKKFSKDTTGIADVILDVIKNLNFKINSKNLICCLYPTSVFCNKKLLIKAKQLLSTKTEYVFSAVRYSHPIFRSFKNEGNNTPKPIFKNNNEKKHTHQLSSSYHDAAQFYLGWASSWRKKKKIFSKKSRFIELNTLKTQDIDNFEDWQIAEFKYKKFYKK